MMTRLPLEPMDPQITSIQPGGGICMRIELTWGYFRRWYLKTFRRGYVAKMSALRRGDRNVCPFEVVDPRDVKFFRNLGGYYWESQDDPFTWRDRLGFARTGLAELWLITSGFLAASAILNWVVILLFANSGSQPGIFPAVAMWVAHLVAWTPAVLGLLIIWFFRNPRRNIPQAPGLIISPADGKVVHIEVLEHDDFLGGPAVVIGIFLSIFNVHINRIPVAARVIGIRYRKGKFLNALRPESARENEQLAVRIEESCAPHRRIIVRQITGAIARRIVCWVKPGDELAAGEQFGMIKLGSRTELVVPREPGLCIDVRLGDMVQAGASVLARYENVSSREAPS
jgi:phosphatidylserine decarboxylase